MRKSIIIILFLSQLFFAAAQRTKSPAYYLTPVSKQYLSDAEIDSLLHSVSSAVFKENMIPAALFEKKYPVIKTLLVALSRNGIIQSFKTIESGFKKNGAVEKGSVQFTNNKQLYIEAMEKQLRAAFYSNKLLSQYLSFNTSDRITWFNSIVRVGTDGKLLVTEKITVYNGNGQPSSIYGNDPSLEGTGAGNNEIKRGIVRTFPLYYINKYKLFQNTTFELKEVLRDGKKEAYHTERHQNGILLYTGRSDVFLEPGKYTYSITYETDHQLKFLNKFDELYWNVTGNGWSFRIDSAMCTVIMPKGTNALSSKCYTGSQGASDGDCNIDNHTTGDSSFIVFKTTKPLMPNQGITIASSWPKGIVSGPSMPVQAMYYVWNNKAVFFLPIAALFGVVFCFIFWFRYGRDPRKGTIYPLFDPPAGLSPAAIGYIYHQEFDQRLTAATIVDAAVRNKIQIDVKRKGWFLKHNEYSISKSKKPEKPPVSKYEEFESDIEDLVGSTIKKGKYNSDLGSLNTAVQSYCEDKYKNKDGSTKKNYKGFFALNNSYTILPMFVCMAAGVWGFIDLVKAIKLENLWQIGYFIGGIILCVIVLRIFSKLLVAYSPEGRKLADKIEGFRMFIATADEKRFDLMNPPKRSLELYEKFLPFAIALGCEIAWGKQFEDIINTAAFTDTATSSFSSSMAHDHSFSSSFASSFSGAISSASSPPSSSSGGGSSFGGGSSGGGGGGGGGGGW